MFTVKKQRSVYSLKCLQLPRSDHLSEGEDIWRVQRDFGRELTLNRLSTPAYKPEGEICSHVNVNLFAICRYLP